MTCRLLAFLFLVLFPVFKIRLVLPRVLSYEKVIALVAEAHVIGECPALVAHILDIYHFMVFQHLFLFGGDSGSHDGVVHFQLFSGLLECDVHDSRIDKGHAGKKRVVLALYVIDGKLPA